MAAPEGVVVNSYPEQLPPGNPNKSLPPGDGGGKFVDPVLGLYLVDPTNNNAPRLRSNQRVALGTVKQRNHKIIPIR